MKTKKILYSSRFKPVKKIKPSKSFIPDWYKNIKAFNKNNIEFHPELGTRPLVTVKSCVPFLDGIMTGYTVELWTDIHISNDGETTYRWAHEPQPMESRIHNKHNSQIPVPAGYSNVHYTWLNPYVIKFPPGYSALIMHPSNRFDLPFYTLSGVVDDEIIVGNLPFFLLDGFEGMIEKGTPIFQIIPFKRENWSAEWDDSTQELEKKHDTGLQSFFNDYYRNNVWSRKEFN
jgi:hypothetical protein